MFSLEEVWKKEPSKLEEAINVKVGSTPYYIVHEKCGKLAHLVVEYKNGGRWYYCPTCNTVFTK